ncbi:BRO-N domain-containing protein [Granulibacter bethesdensis]|uniref:BRO-N domain-containing protein n=1 Tax=Granulibacter bethesdensis TaxID=364410 RepID=UPI0003F204E8|nr:Bro-N domain-containing protein [Granulibacter bethesdensis]AHJ66389.1 Phage antirepressor protein [Granulibacter bethesdensis CGDNIH4]
MSSIIPLDFEGSAVRVMSRAGEPWFVLSDVCRVLEIANSRHAATRLDDDEKGVVNSDTLGGSQEMTIINESGLYSLILTSRKEAARRFKKWVTAEVLPSIRKTGTYGHQTTPEEWFTRFAKVLCIWDLIGEEAAGREWHLLGISFAMPSRAAVRLLMEAAMGYPARGGEASTLPTGFRKKLSARHNGALGGRPRQGETAAQARSRRLNLVEKEVITSEDGTNAVVMTYSTQRKN